MRKINNSWGIFVVPIFIGIIVIIGSIILNNDRNRKGIYMYNGRYTIAKVIDINKGRFYDGINYEFKIDSISYKSKFLVRKPFKRRKYVFIKYSIKDPKINKILIRKVVPTNIEIIPIMGWDSIEFYSLFPDQRSIQKTKIKN